jgi:uncharacterized oxidoreductase
MNLSNQTVLVTGGASGIGLALAARYLRAGATVIVCGRREAKLHEAAARHPGLQTRVCDVGASEDRIALYEWTTRAFPKLNVLVNNAGIQRRQQVADAEVWETTREEIAINLDAPIHLSRLFLPHLQKQPTAAIVNVTSGLAFSPLANVPVYCATKAALRSFTLSLRHQLANTAVKVVEVIPPAVDTDLGGPGLHTFGAPLEDFADSVFQRLAAGELEIPYGRSEVASRASRAELDRIFAQMNG